MSSGVSSFQLTSGAPANTAIERLSAEKPEARIARFERLGLQLFSVANCFITFGRLAGRGGSHEHPISEMEAVFSDYFPLTDDVVLIEDLMQDAEMAQLPYVAGAPFIRFYASYPVHDMHGKLVACIRLIDYQPRKLDSTTHLLLADMAVLIQHELALTTLCQQQHELLKQNRYLKREAMIDPLLGTWNKGAIIRSLGLELERCRKAEKPLSLMFVFPDQIELLRRDHGVSGADQILIRMVSRIRSCIRPFDALGRFGEDQFLIVLPGASHLVSFAVAERIRLAVMMHPEPVNQVPTKLTVCTGTVSTDAFPDADPEALVGLAERALLSAKRAGNNSVVQAEPGQPT